RRLRRPRLRGQGAALLRSRTLVARRGAGGVAAGVTLRAGQFFDTGRRDVSELVAQSAAMREAVRLASRVAATDANVLVTGESGAGKDALALYIHRQSRRSSEPFVKIDCASLPGALL